MCVSNSNFLIISLMFLKNEVQLHYLFIIRSLFLSIINNGYQDMKMLHVNKCLWFWNKNSFFLLLINNLFLWQNFSIKNNWVNFHKIIKRSKDVCVALLILVWMIRVKLINKIKKKKFSKKTKINKTTNIIFDQKRRR